MTWQGFRPVWKQNDFLFYLIKKESKKIKAWASQRSTINSLSKGNQLADF